MQKVSIKPEPMPLQQAVRLFEGLNATGRKEFYKTLSDDEKDALYTMATDNLIASVHLTTKNRIDGNTNKDRNVRRGYIVPDECHSTENECLWRSGAWYFINGDVSESLWNNLSHMREHFDALKEAEKHHGNTSGTGRNS